MLPDLRGPAPDTRPRRRVALFGSTGSIGTQTLEVAAAHPDRVEVVALVAGTRWRELAEQARRVQPETVALADEASLPALRDALADLDVEVVGGADAVEALAGRGTFDVVVAAIVGAAGLRPTLAAVRAGTAVALANKESLVVAGELVAREAAASGAVVLPVDSEHSAIFQCLVGEPAGSVERLTLTASGGPFRDRPAGTFGAITRDEALAHPNWAMGAKNSIDSATLMNKGLEVIEARWMFGVRPDQIDVAVHPSSVVHSVVTFVDGSTKAQLSPPDMGMPIQYALSYPHRWPSAFKRHALPTDGPLDFEPPDLDRFPALGLAFEAMRRGGAAPAGLNAANEVAVERFLAGSARFTDIPRIAARGLDAACNGDDGSLAGLLAADAAARRLASEA